MILTILLSQYSTGQIIPIQGGSENLIIPEYPFYIPFLRSTPPPECHLTLHLNITRPHNLTTIYFPTITPNVTFTLTGSNTPVCYYRLNINELWYEWNNWSDCGEGDGYVNHKLITMPEGYPTILEVMVNDSSCTVSDSRWMFVYYFAPQSKYNDDDWFVMAYLGIGFILIMYAAYLEGYLDSYT